ncbi:hypothetical protein H8D29_06530 [PVC group bacterium]|nr:hypothetical protein [PVC group bacterium]
MKKLHITIFIELCEEVTIHPSIALENEELCNLIESGGSKAEIREYLIENF